MIAQLRCGSNKQSGLKRQKDRELKGQIQPVDLSHEVRLFPVDEPGGTCLSFPGWERPSRDNSVEPHPLKFPFQADDAGRRIHQNGWYRREGMGGMRLASFMVCHSLRYHDLR